MEDYLSSDDLERSLPLRTPLLTTEQNDHLLPQMLARKKQNNTPDKGSRRVKLIIFLHLKDQ